MKPKMTFAVVAVLSMVMAAAATLTHNRSVAASGATEAADRILQISGTGILEEHGGRYRLVAPMAPEVDLGIVDKDTTLLNFATRLQGSDGEFDGHSLHAFIGQRITVMAEVEANIDSEKVFVTARSRYITFLNGTHVLP